MIVRLFAIGIPCFLSSCLAPPPCRKVKPLHRKISSATTGCQQSQLNDRVIYFAKKDSCVKVDGKGVTQVEQLNTNHEKTDTKICHLLHHALQMNNGQETVCIVRSGDVDILVILLANEAKNLHVFMDNGRGKYKERYLYYGSKRFLACMHFQGMTTSHPSCETESLHFGSS